VTFDSKMGFRYGALEVLCARALRESGHAPGDHLRSRYRIARGCSGRSISRSELRSVHHSTSRPRRCARQHPWRVLNPATDDIGASSDGSILMRAAVVRRIGTRTVCRATSPQTCAAGRYRNIASVEHVGTEAKRTVTFFPDRASEIPLDADGPMASKRGLDRLADGPFDIGWVIS